MKYDKIETYYNRDRQFKVDETKPRLREFALIDKWAAWEKIEGTNTRIMLAKGEKTTPFRGIYGREEKSQFHPLAMKYLEDTFTVDNLKLGWDKADHEHGDYFYWIFGETYGPKIQKGGNYRKDISFRMFDAWVRDRGNPLGGWWLQSKDLEALAKRMSIETAPFLGYKTIDEIVEYVKEGQVSKISLEEGGNPEYLMEGVVCRTTPQLYTRRGKRLMFKLKTKDFKNESKEKVD